MAAIWRDRDLEQIIGASLDEDGFTETAIEKIVREFPNEEMRVEYKSHRDFARTPGTTSKQSSYPWTPLQEHAKDICAPANSRGAIVIYGVENAGEISARMRPFDGGDPDKLIEQYRKDIRQYSSPTPRFDMFPVRTPDRSRFYIIAVVPPSPNAPHAVLEQKNNGRGQLYFFVRAEGESHIRPLAEHEVADLYGRRNQTLETRREHVTRVWHEGETRVRESSDKIWAAVSVVPDVRRDDALTPSVQSEIEEWDDCTSYPDSVLGLAQPVLDRGFPEMGMMVYTELVEVDRRFRTPAAVRGYRELHADGSGFAALLLRDTPDNAEPWDLEEDQLVDTLAALTVHMLSWTTFRAGQWGNATVKAGIIGGDNLDGRFRTSTRLVDGAGGSSGGRGLRLVRRQPRAEVLAHLEELGTTQNKLRIAYSVTSRILQSFGVVEPRWLSDSGAVDVTEMLRDQKFLARQWAEGHDVELIRNRRTHR